MKRKTWKRVLSSMFAVAMAVTCLSPAGSVRAAEVSYAAQQESAVYDGTNIEYQDYTRWTSPIGSYLTRCADGDLMRVQYVASAEGILIEYYDPSYQLLSSKMITSELPIFGGFYETEEYYFIMTGQTNQEESPDKDVYQITKFDKEWNKIVSVGLRNCNTTVPFDAGCVRMDSDGTYLVIRTSHEMYRTPDGYNHQANVTIQMDMETMYITDVFADVLNEDYGYVSHSFNQFIKIDNDHIVALDHGDAYPRAMVLTKYSEKVSSGRFFSGYGSRCSVTNVLEFPGEVGDNSTGASAGGFELSDSAYLVAGNSVAKGQTDLGAVRNVFVAAVDKNSGRVAMNWLTDYGNGESSASTPHMVKIDGDRYMVLWSRDDAKVYYTMVDGNGRQTGSIYEMEGHLSDCVPVLVDNKLTWYTWDDGTIIFYGIDTDDPAETQTKKLTNGGTEDNSWADGTVTVGSVTLDTVKNKAKGKMRISWEQYPQADGYQIEYSVNKKFSPDKTMVKNVKASVSAKTIAGLSKGKTYYVRVRAYQKDAGQTYYGDWSNVKKVKIKK